MHKDWKECTSIGELIEKMSGNAGGYFSDGQKAFRLDISDVIERAIQLHEEKKHKLTIKHIDEESMEFLLDGHFFGSANHDSDGWHSMEKIEAMLTSMANLTGIEIEHIYE